jgi:hypothetical protein
MVYEKNAYYKMVENRCETLVGLLEISESSEEISKISQELEKVREKLK